MYLFYLYLLLFFKAYFILCIPKKGIGARRQKKIKNSRPRARVKFFTFYENFPFILPRSPRQIFMVIFKYFTLLYTT